MDWLVGGGNIKCLMVTIEVLQIFTPQQEQSDTNRGAPINRLRFPLKKFCNRQLVDTCM